MKRKYTRLRQHNKPANPTQHHDRLMQLKAIDQKLIDSRKHKQQKQPMNNTRTIQFLSRGITPVTLPSQCSNIVLDTTLAAQRCDSGMTLNYVCRGDMYVNTKKPLSRRDLHRQEVKLRKGNR